MRFLSLLAVMILSAAPALARPHDNAVTFSGSALLTMCSSKYDTDYGYCAGYVSAVANTLLTESVGGYRACNLELTRSQQFVDIFKSYALNTQDTLDGDANAAVAAALARAFPCL